MIEFDDVQPDGDGVDEDLPQPRERRWPGSARVRRALAVGATVLVGGGIIAYAQWSNPDSTGTAARSGGPTPATASLSSPPLSTVPQPDAPQPSVVASSSVSGGLLVEHLGDRNGTLRNDVEVSIPARLVAPACPQSSDGFASCVGRSGVPSAFAAAVRNHYPQATGAAADTSTLRSGEPFVKAGLWSRIYHARIDRDRLTILITRNESDDEIDPVTVRVNGQDVVYLRHVDGRYRIEVQLRAPIGHALPTNGLLALAADPRLVRS